jgi:hypothetical protein
MPLNESSGPKRSNLTREQKREAEAAILGLNLKEHLMADQLTQAEIERMRQIVQQHDGDNNSLKQEFDLNNPPKQPYRHQPYPLAIHHHEKRHTLIVNNEKEKKAALEEGYQEKPFPAEAETGAPNADTLRLAETIDQQLKEARKQKGK